MLITLNFHPVLQEFTGVERHSFNVSSISDLKDAIAVLFPKMRRYMFHIATKNLHKENLVYVKPDGELVTKKEFEFGIKEEGLELTLCPLVGGGGRKLLPILMIVAAVVIIAFAGPIAAGVGLKKSAVLKIGIQLALSGIMMLMQPTPKSGAEQSNSSQQRRNNDMFDAMENTTDPNSGIPLIYGRPRVSGQMLSGHVETLQHGESDVIFARDVIYSNIEEITTTG